MKKKVTGSIPTLKNLLFVMFIILNAMNYTYAQTVSFGMSDLQGASLYLPTSLQFGPDGKLYVAQQQGEIKIFTVEKVGPNSYKVTKTETINLIKNIPNHDDDGTPNPNVKSRQITGILVVGTAANPIIYVTSSDPRIGAGLNGGDVNLDTNSGIISRLTWNGTAWVKADLVRGLPRSEENHSVNGMALDQNTNTLYLGIGGNTNQGAPSNNFAGTPEYAYSAAILSVNLNAIGNTTYDLPTLDDEDRAGTNDSNDPFGGNDGKNQAVLVQGGPVQVYSPGWRNPYDVLITESGKLYSIDNGPNAGWGGVPDNCTNKMVEAGNTYWDNLHLITGPGYYKGHPNPTRASRSNTFNATNPQSPIPAGMEDPRQCTYKIPGQQDGAIATISTSTNGLTEYTSTKFSSAMKGNLIAAGWDGKIYRFQLTGDGTALAPNGKTVLFSGFGSNPLDVTALGDNSPFPGTIWVASLVSSKITVFEPEDNGVCNTTDPNGDADLDKFTNGDEIANGTDPCSPASVPSDWDKDFISDLNDPDDDNDGMSDVSDKFALDSKNGSQTAIPAVYTWDNGEPPRGGILNLGFTGLMTNGSSNYSSLFNPDNMTAGGAAGVLTIDAVSEGDALGNTNTQEYAMQFGANVANYTGKYSAHTRILAPFAGLTPQNNMSMGIYIGTGDQNNYIKITTAANGGNGGIEVLFETNGTPAPAPASAMYGPSDGVNILGSSFVDLYLIVNPGNNTVQPAYSVNNGQIKNLGAPRTVPAPWLHDQALAVGIISTSRGPAPEFAATWDKIELVPEASGTAATVVVDPGNFFSASTYTKHSFRITNNSPAAQKITKVTFDLSTSMLPDMVFDPNGTAGDPVGKVFTPDSNAVLTGLAGHNFIGAKDGGFTGIEVSFNDFNPGEIFTFSTDIDPTSIKGATAPGPNESGSVSGLEIAGATITVQFDDGSIQKGELYRIPNNSGSSQNIIKQTSPAAPSISVAGHPILPARVSDTQQTIKVTGTAGANVSLLILEGGLFLAGVPNGGFDLDGFEANSIIKVTEKTAVIGSSGTVDIPVTLTRGATESGLNYIAAVIKEADGRTSDLSNVAILELNANTVTEIRIKSGSSSDVTVGGVTFSADNYFNPSFVYQNNSITDILGTDMDVLYKSERSSSTDKGSFSYSIPLPNGNYTVWLHFAEIYFGAPSGDPRNTPGLRVFNVNIEGQPRLVNYDIIADAGTMTASIKKFDVFVNDGTLNLDFSASVNRPKISAIEILSPGNPSVNVELLSFEASKNEAGVSLYWSTATETGNRGFEIERSIVTRQNTGDLQWQMVAFVPGAGNSTQKQYYNYTDKSLHAARKYYYRLKQIDMNGSYTYSPQVEVVYDRKLSYELAQNFPNPFNPVTKINYSVPAEGKVKVSVFNLLGETVKVLVDEVKQPGVYEVSFDASGLNSGIYFYRLETENYSSLKKMVLLK